MDNSELIVILGASHNPNRPSYLANKLLKKKGFKTYAIEYGGEHLENLQIPTFEKEEKTISIFLKPNQQKKYYSYLLSLKPSRIIFNPGTDNEELKLLALQNNIKVLSGCTISLLINSLL